MKRAVLLLVLSIFPVRALLAVSLPTGLRSSDIDRMVAILGPAGATRLMRSAEAYPPLPGFKIGAEVFVVPVREMSTLGNGDGISPSLLPAPRIYLAKGLPWDLELIVSLLPTTMSNSIATWGGALKWTLQNEEKAWWSLAGYFSYTNLNGFSSAYLGNDFEAGLVASKDYVRLKPYLGGGFLVAQGSVFGVNGSLQPTLHLFVGLEVELPANLSVQVDFMNFYPMASFFVGKKF